MKSAKSIVGIVSFLVFTAPILILVIASTVMPARRTHAQQTLSVAPAAADYTGSKACEPCHVKEFRIQSQSHHAHTMHVGSGPDLGALAPPVGKIAGTEYVITKSNGSFQFCQGKQVAGGRSASIQYALGSGIANITYIGDLEKYTLTEFRMSFNPGMKTWYITPGQETTTDIALGVSHPPGVSRRCVLCHSDATVPGKNVPRPGSLGVGCESCHGPGSLHVKAMQSGQMHDPEMSSIRKVSAHELNMICARCHRSINDIPLSGLEPVSTARFQPYAIEISPCFRKSGGALSCLTCHDPHANASTDIKAYEKACLNCHETGKSKHACPVSPGSGCIPCHMPKKRVLPGTKIPIQLTDHLIWAYRRKQP